MTNQPSTLNPQPSTVYKYELATSVRTEVEIPTGAHLLCVNVQNDRIFLWALISPEAPKEKRIIEIYGTGHDMQPAERRFINTFFVKNAMYVFHAFEVI